MKPWSISPRAQRRLWIGFVIILVLTLIPGFFIHPHAKFGIDGGFGFYAWFGFAACALMVVLAKLLGFVLKRKDRYYD